jgi:peptidoglycan hydrolase-like protein with peptidoglycan-binding domain
LVAFRAPTPVVTHDPGTLRTERTGDANVNCMDQAYAYLRQHPELAAGSQVVFLQDQRNADGNNAGHVVIQLPDGRFIDPARPDQPQTLEQLQAQGYMPVNAQGQPAAGGAGAYSLSGQQFMALMQAPVSRRDAMMGAMGVPTAIRSMRLADDPITPRPQLATQTVSVAQGTQGTGQPGDPVYDMAHRLLELGFVDPATANHANFGRVFGPGTADALRAFQLANGLPMTPLGQDVVIDQATANLLASPTARGAPFIGLTQNAQGTGQPGDPLYELAMSLDAAGVVPADVRSHPNFGKVFGPGTADAVRAFQQANGLPVTPAGEQVVLTPLLAQMIFNAGSAAPAAPVQPVTPPTTGAVPPTTGPNPSAGAQVTPGTFPPPAPSGFNPAAMAYNPASPTVNAPGTPVDAATLRAVQTRLNDLGYMPPHIGTSEYGNRFGVGTAFAIMDFQRAHGLPLTGVIDQATASQLLNPTVPGRFQGRPAGATAVMPPDPAYLRDMSMTMAANPEHLYWATQSPNPPHSLANGQGWTGLCLPFVNAAFGYQNPMLINAMTPADVVPRLGSNLVAPPAPPAAVDWSSVPPGSAVYFDGDWDESTPGVDVQAGHVAIFAGMVDGAPTFYTSSWKDGQSHTMSLEQMASFGNYLGYQRLPGDPGYVG